MDREKLQKANELVAEIKASENAVAQMTDMLSIGLSSPADVVECFLDAMPDEMVRRLSALAVGMAQERRDFLMNKVERLNKELDAL